ncbi:MAG: hypothetical protein QXR45_08955 [Candidatus Bathyarchaeia archaeon]
MKRGGKENENMPLFYRVILKIPKLDLETISKSERFHGVFWAAILPSFILGDIFLNMLFLVILNFPFNVLSVIVVNTIFILLILRILIERALRTEKALLSQGFDWNFEKSFRDYISLIQKEDEDKNSS